MAGLLPSYPSRFSARGHLYCRNFGSAAFTDMCCVGEMSGDNFFDQRNFSIGAWRRSLLDCVLYCDSQMDLAAKTGFMALKVAVAVVLGIVIVFQIPQSAFKMKRR